MTTEPTTLGELLDALDFAGYPLKSIEETGNPLASFWVKATFHVRGTKDDTVEFHDWNPISAVMAAYRQLIGVEKPRVPVLNDPSLGDEFEILVNGHTYRRI